jgi:hypothetical protein
MHCGSLIRSPMFVLVLHYFFLVASSSMGALRAGAGASPDSAKNQSIEDECLLAAFAVLRALS